MEPHLFCLFVVMVQAAEILLRELCEGFFEERLAGLYRNLPKQRSYGDAVRLRSIAEINLDRGSGLLYLGTREDVPCISFECFMTLAVRFKSL